MHEFQTGSEMDLGYDPRLCHHFSQQPPRVKLGRDLVRLTARGLGFILPSISHTFVAFPSPRGPKYPDAATVSHHGGLRESDHHALMYVLRDRAVYCSVQKQISYTFRGYVLLGEM